uniref:Uncharacterized protein n=2 Tax=Viruses TaxID=10239 RepID=A0AAU8L012_9CAUD
MHKFTWNREAFDNHWLAVRTEYEAGNIQFSDFVIESNRLRKFVTQLSIDISAQS